MARFGRHEESEARSAAEREAARLERERRRAEREGRALPQSPVNPDEPRWEDDEPVAHEPDHEAPAEDTAPDEPRWEDDEPVAHEPEHQAPIDEDAAEVRSVEPAPMDEARADEDDADDAAAEAVDRAPVHEAPAHDGPPALVPPEPDDSEPEVTREPPANGDGPDPEPSEPAEPVTITATRRTVSLPRPQTDDDLGHHGDSWDKPIGTRRVTRAEYQAQPGASGMPPYRSIGVPKSRRGIRRILPVLSLLIVVAVAVFAYFLYQPFHGKGFGSVAVRVPAGATASQIGDLLASEGVVDSSFFFSLRARLAGDRGTLRAGTYRLKQSMTYGEALTALTTAPKAAPTIDVTLPEGPSRRELARTVKQAGVHGDYVRASARSRRLNPRNYGAPRGTGSLEGFLFPDTYELRRSGATARKLVDAQVRRFKRQFGKVNLRGARRRNLSAYDVLIIASMIEREAVVRRDRPLISAVIYNRLRQGIPIGIDATLRYRLNNWTRPLRQSELKTSSAFNTRLRKGLPPTPIGNPGMSSIRAAAHPAKVGYLFYVVKPCGNGAHAFSSTNAKFERDVAAYNRARDKRGGKDPSHC